MEKKRYATLLSAAFMLTLAAAAQSRSFRLGGLSGAVDTCLHRVLFTLPEGADSGAAGLCLETLPAPLSAEVDGQPLGADGALPLAEGRGERVLTLAAEDGRTERWTLDFTTLPLVIVDTSGLPISKGSDTPARIELIDAAGRLPGGTEWATRGNIHGRGASSYQLFPKKSYTLKLLDDEGKKSEASLLGNREEDTWVLDAMACDLARMRNRVCFDVWNAVGVKAPHALRAGTQGEFVELTVNGRYMGLYCMGDKVNRTLLGAKKTRSADEVRGVIYKGIAWGGPSIVLMHDAEAPTDVATWHNWEMAHPDTLPSAETWAPLFELIDFTDCGDFGRMAREWSEWFDARNATYLPVFFSAFNLRDNFLKNAYLALHDYAADVRGWWIQPWDLDYGFNRDYRGALSTVQADLESIVHNTMPFAILLEYNLGDYRSRCAEAWREMRRGPLNEAAVEKRLRGYETLFEASGAWRRERERWSGDPLVLPELSEEVDYMVEWYKSNCARLDDYYAALVSAAGSVRLAPDSAPEAVCTLDGRRIAPTPQGIEKLPRGVYVVGGRKVLR